MLHRHSWFQCLGLFYRHELILSQENKNRMVRLTGQSVTESSLLEK